MHQDDSVNLAQAIPFVAEDLIANRNGHLSDSQLARLKPEIAQNRTLSKYALLFVVLVYVLVVGIGVATNLDYFTSRPREALGLGVGSGIFVLGLVVTTIMTFRGYNSQRQFRVHEVAGMAKRETDNYEGFTYRIIRVKNVKFTVGEAVYDAFRDGRHYHIYYVRLFRHILRILSVEETTA